MASSDKFQKLSVQWKALTKEEVEIERKDMVERIEHLTEKAGDSLDDFHEDIIDEKALNKAAEDLIQFSTTVYEFVSTYKKRRDLGEENSNENVLLWWGPLQKKAKTVIKDLGIAARDKRKLVSDARKQDEEKKKQEKAAAAEASVLAAAQAAAESSLKKEEENERIRAEEKHEKEQSKASIDALAQIVAFELAFKKADDSVVGATKLMDHATEVCEDLELLNEAQESVEHAINSSYKALAARVKMDGTNVTQVEGEHNTRLENCTKIQTLIASTKVECFQKRAARWDADPEKRERAFRHGMEADTGSPSGARTSRHSSPGASPHSSSFSSFSNIKTEKVEFPDFKLESEARAVQDFPVWKKSWEALITLYPPDHQAMLLRKHIGKCQARHIDGVQDDYVESMRRLTLHYGDEDRFVRVVTSEIEEFLQIKSGSYTQCVTYSQLLQAASRKLKVLGKTGELSNSTTMRQIMGKFEPKIREDWARKMMTLKPQTDVLEELIKWLEETQIPTWKKLSSWEDCKKPVKPDPVKPVKGPGGKEVGAATSTKEVLKSCRFCHSDKHSTRDCEKRKALVCTHCNMVGHLVQDCFQLHPEKRQGNKGEKKKQGKGRGGAGQTGQSSANPSKLEHKQFRCANCRHPQGGHDTLDCEYIKKHMGKKPGLRAELIKDNRDCIRCLGDHDVNKCPISKATCGCAKGHDTHKYCCKEVSFSAITSTQDGSSAAWHKPSAVLELMKCPSPNKTIRPEWGCFWDSGATSNFIKEDTAIEFGFRGRPVSIRMLTMDGETTKEYTRYNCKMRNLNGELRHFTALGVPNILDEIDPLNPMSIEKLFPHMRSWNEVLDCLRPTEIDVLIGQDRKSWQPDKFIRSNNGGDLWLMTNEFGSTIGGQHPELGHVGVRWADSSYDDNGFFAQTYSCFKAEIISEEYLDNSLEQDFHEMEYCGRRVVKSESDLKYILENFEKTEGLMVDNRQACGNCSCRTCTLPGAKHSFQGEIDLKRIKDCLTYKRSERRWYADLPWLPGCSAEDLPETEKISDQLMLQTEKSLKKNPTWEFAYNQQIEELIERGGARVVSKKELEDHKKTGKRIYYLSHLAVQQPMKTTPVRWCLDPSRKLMGGPSPNDLLTVGPSTHVNNLAAILLSFRYGRKNMVSVCDIRKMHQRVALNRNSSMMQLIKWRFCKEDTEIQTIAIICNTFGYVCANSIATASFHSSAEEIYYLCTHQILARQADEGVSEGIVPAIGKKPERELFLRGTTYDDVKVETLTNTADSRLGITEEIREGEERYPFSPGLTNDDIEDFTDQELLDMWFEAREICIDLSYIDDLLAGFKNKKRQKVVKYLVDVILDRCGMPSKGWLDYESCKDDDIKELGGEKLEKTLGMAWLVKRDIFVFQISVKFSGKCSKKSYEAEKWTVKQLIENPPPVLTRRMVLRETAKVFDPLGLICPVLLEAKLLIRESWNGLTVPLWDDPLEEEQRIRWLKWFVDIHLLEQFVISRSVIPEGEFIGDPDLVSLADGSPQAFGACVYLVYAMKDGTFWSALLCARSKIARRGHNSIPRTELSGSLVSERLKKFILKKTKIKVNRCFHLLDSATVLHWLNLKGDKKNVGVFEGIRIAEILESNESKPNGNLVNWGHIDRKYNSADLTTRATSVTQIQSDFWLKGPSFLSTLPVEEWPVNWDFVIKKEKTEKDEDLKYHVDFTESLNQIQTREAGIVIGRDTVNWINNYLKDYSDLNKILRLITWFLLFLSRLAAIKKHWKDGRILRNQQFVPQKNVLVLHKVRSKEDIQRATRVWIRTFQDEIREELEKELIREDTLKSEKKKVFKKSKYSILALFKDENGIYRVGSRLRQVTTITESGQMPALMPSQSRSHFLQMKLSHEVEHTGDDRTILRFCRDGYFALKSMKVARKIRLDCFHCQGLDPLRCFQKMGDFDGKMLECDTPWSFLQLDLFGPYKVTENRKTLKRWGLMIVDVVSGAVYADLMEDYSSPSVLMTLDRFQSFYGWPQLISSDPGSQLESAAGKVEEWWTLMGKDLLRLAGHQGFDWNVSPAKSPWYQGRVEKKIGLLKKLLMKAVGDTKLTTLALLTSIRSCVFLLNSRPISINAKVNKEGSYSIITPNDLLLGRNSSFLDMSELSEQLKDSPVTRNLQLIAQIRQRFYRDVSTMVLPKYFIREKWHYEIASMPEVNDVVRIHDYSQFKNHWKLAVVKEVHPSRDNRSRSYTLEYVILREKMKPRRMEVTRSSQRLSLVAKADHFDKLVEIETTENFPECTTTIRPRVSILPD